MEVEGEEAAEDFVLIGEDFGRPAIGGTDGVIEGGVELMKAGGEGGGFGLKADGFEAAMDIEGVIEVGEGAMAAVFRAGKP